LPNSLSWAPSSCLRSDTRRTRGRTSLTISRP
jgi:hypothetical protein